MRSIVILAIGLFVTACQTTPVGSGVFRFAEDYKKQKDYMALVATDRHRSYSGWASGYSYEQATAVAAVKVATEFCEKAARQYQQVKQCKVLYLGQVFVGDMDVNEDLIGRYQRFEGIFKSKTGNSDTNSQASAPLIVADLTDFEVCVFGTLMKGGGITWSKNAYAKEARAEADRRKVSLQDCVILGRGTHVAQ